MPNERDITWALIGATAVLFIEAGVLVGGLWLIEHGALEWLCGGK